MKETTLSLITCGALAAACGNNGTETTASVYPDEGEAMTRIDQEPLVDAEQAYSSEIAQGPEYEAQGPEYEAQGPQYEEIELGIDPSIANRCGVEQAPKVYFAFDSAEIRPDSEQKIREVARCLQSDEYLEGEPLTITGHADPRGTEEYNRELGLDRANAVAKVLRQSGVGSDRIDTYSRGEFLASSTPDEWPQNRRVEIRLDH